MCTYICVCVCQSMDKHHHPFIHPVHPETQLDVTVQTDFPSTAQTSQSRRPDSIVQGERSIGAKMSYAILGRCLDGY